jgi:hypothetical protein
MSHDLVDPNIQLNPSIKTLTKRENYEHINKTTVHLSMQMNGN